MKEPWYIIEYKHKTYLHNKELCLKEFACDLSDHDHCELCWARFSMNEGDLHSGYYDSDTNSWICKTCYSDFKDLFNWSDENNDIV